MIGQKLNNRYKISSRLGKGAMGTVYRATDTQTGQEVALKVISSELAIDPSMLERFKREGEALRQLKHPNIVGFIDAFEHEEHYVIVMEHVPGGSLHDLLREGPLPIERARRIALELCDALIRSHHLNIIHRDIKPENVLIAEDGTPKLADFGVARLNEGTRMTRSGTQVGTPYYMAPESWEGKALDAQADIWSLGVLLFEMLTGQVPFGGDTGAAVMNKVLTTQPPDPKKLRVDVPLSLVKITRRMLTRDRNRRYPTMREVAVDLERDQRATTPVPAKAKPASWRPALIGLGLVLAISAIWLTTNYQRAQSTAQVAEPTSTLLSTATPQPSSTPIPSPTPILPGAILFSEDFEDGELQGITLLDEIKRWQLVTDETGNIVYEADNREGSSWPAMTFGSQEWKDYAFEFRMRYPGYNDDSWGVIAQVRTNKMHDTGYILNIDNDNQGSIGLVYTEHSNPWVGLISKDVRIDPGIWHLVRVEAQGDQIRAFLNGTLIIDITDSQIRQGQIDLVVGPGGHAQFDDIRVTALGEAATPTPSLESGERLKGCGVDICIESYDGSKSTPLGLSDEFAGIDTSYVFASWSPDGSQIAFSGCSLEAYVANPTNCTHEIFIINRDGTGLFNLTNSDANDISPAWSPDGELIAVNANGDLLLIQPDGLEKARLMQGTSSTRVHRLVWSPDSQRIAWQAITDSGDTFVVWVINRDGSGLHSINEESGSNSTNWGAHLAWSPDGQWVGIERIDGSSVYLIDADCDQLSNGCDESSRISIDELPEDWLPIFHPQWVSEFRTPTP